MPPLLIPALPSSSRAGPRDPRAAARQASEPTPTGRRNHNHGPAEGVLTGRAGDRGLVADRDGPVQPGAPAGDAPALGVTEPAFA